MASNQAEKQLLSIKDRLITAIFAPIIFNLGILITALALRIYRDELIFKALDGSGALLLFTSIALPATLGFILGSKRFSTLLGHFFYSNIEHQKNIRKTLLCWLGFLLLNYLFLELSGLL